MAISAVSLILLIAAIAVGFVLRMNVGLLSVLMAALLGYDSGQFTGKEIIAGFNGSLFLTLAGVTLLFSIVQNSGALELLIQKVVRRIGRYTVLVPVAVFIFGWVVSASGPGLIPTAAVVAAIAIPIARQTGFHPLMLGIIGIHAANAGRFTMLTTEGNLITTLLEDQGYMENIITPMCVSCTIIAALLSVIAYIWYKGYRVKASDIEFSAEEHFTGKQLLALAGMLAMSVLILVFKWEVGLAAFTASSVLLIFRVCDEKTAIKGMPWSTILLVLGVGVLMNLVIELGGIDLLSEALASVMNPTTTSALCTITGGVMSWFSSTLGVVIPTLIPTTSYIIESVGGGVSVLEVVAAIGFASSTAGLSPASTAGALMMSVIEGDEEYSKQFKPEKLFIELFAWAAVGIGIIALIALTGYFRWF